MRAEPRQVPARNLATNEFCRGGLSTSVVVGQVSEKAQGAGREGFSWEFKEQIVW